MAKGIVMSDMSYMFKGKGQKFEELRGVIFWKLIWNFHWTNKRRFVPYRPPCLNFNSYYHKWRYMCMKTAVQLYAVELQISGRWLCESSIFRIGMALRLNILVL